MLQWKLYCIELFCISAVWLGNACSCCTESQLAASRGSERVDGRPVLKRTWAPQTSRNKTPGSDISFVLLSLLMAATHQKVWRIRLWAARLPLLGAGRTVVLLWLKSRIWQLGCREDEDGDGDTPVFRYPGELVWSESECSLISLKTVNWHPNYLLFLSYNTIEIQRTQRFSVCKFDFLQISSDQSWESWFF